jgi:hypothetical protein
VDRRVSNDADGRPREEMTSIDVLAMSSRPSNNGVPQRDTTYAGKPAVIETMDQEDPKVRQVSLIWERSTAHWIKLMGIGDFADEQAVRSLADTLVDTDKKLSLDISVAPAGWELQDFKAAGPDGDGAVTSMQDPTNPDRVTHVSTMLTLAPDYGNAVGGGPRDVTSVSVNGRHGSRPDPRRKADVAGSAARRSGFQLQVPANVTQQQVVELTGVSSTTPLAVHHLLSRWTLTARVTAGRCSQPVRGSRPLCTVRTARCPVAPRPHLSVVRSGLARLGCALFAQAADRPA